ncbi:MAG: MiaB/RimO family radical SAM methylthiotransferase [Candidatus Omnitrophica bacterium]|nr:MiaB/RimO family radical SAM methylthiotransferase [Candidatus Omnitrophota bacterium]
MKSLSKIGILSLGCPRNLVDSEHILGQLKFHGHPIVDIQDADIAVINTCAFIEDAKAESIQAILDLIELKKSGKLKKVIVYGCLAQRYQEKLRREFPEVDAFVGRSDLVEEPKRVALTPGHYAYLKICEGCLNNCSFCVIPKIKSTFRSLKISSVLKQAEGFNRQGLSELNIIGQDITGYGLDLYGKFKLAQLVKSIARKSPRIGWLRLLYLYPSRVSDDLLKLIRDEPRLCKYIDLPIQHINDRILKSMNRHTTKRCILELIERARKIIPGVCLRTAIIVGFPSETEREFKELLGFIKDVQFERLGAFVYSREEDTPAFSFPGQLNKKVKLARFDAVMSAQQEISRQVNLKFLGRTLKVLIDEKGNDYYIGRSEFDAPEVDGQVYVNSKRPFNPGDFVEVKITDTLEYDLVGKG